MPVFELQGPDGASYEIDAPDENAALGAFRGMQSPVQTNQSTMQPPGVPEYQPPGVSGYDPQTGNVQQYSAPGSAAMGAADMAGMGLADEGAAGLGYLIDKLPGGQGRGYSQILDEINSDQDAAFNQNKGSYRAGEGAAIAAQLLGGPIAGLVRGGTNVAVNAAAKAPSLGRMALDGMRLGTGMGAISGAGNGRNLADRAIGAGVGGLAGGILGGAAPYAATILGKAVSPFVAPLMSRIRPDAYTSKALGTALQRSGMSADDVAGMLSQAQADNQGMFNVADAIGNAGQRMLSTAARNPHDGRQTLTEALQQRQTGQGNRLVNFLTESFGAPDTAAQLNTKLTGARTAAADANYSAARRGAGPVNLNGALGEIDSLLGRDPILGDTALSQGPLGSRLSALRDQMQKGGEQLIDFDKVLNIKSDMYQQMQRNPQVANDLRTVYDKLDKALEGASQGYRRANDTYRTHSGVIDAIDTGTGMASGRTRAADNIQQFNAMTSMQQQAARVGYVDPLIARIESASGLPTTNKARQLINDKLGAEFPALAQPGKGNQLGNRVAREQRMFETANTALGGSKTSDNLADAADMADFDPTILSHLAKGKAVAAVVAGVTKALSAGKGMPPTVLNRLSQALMETDPAAARTLLSTGTNKNLSEAGRRAIYSAVLSRLGSVGAINAATGNN